MQKQYAVIGLGKFGFHVAKGLSQQGVQVIAVDIDEEKIQEVNDYVDDAVILDSTDIKALREAGIGSVDVAVVSIGENIESSILTVMALKDLKVQIVVAKALTPIHGQILSKLGASKVIYPEMESARKVVKKIVDSMNYETIDLSKSMKIAKFKVPKFLVGFSVVSSVFEDDYGVKLIAYKHQDKWHTLLKKEDTLEKEDIIVVIGDNEKIKDLSLKVAKI